MIAVKVEELPEAYVVTIKGHAGFAEAGKDIVCAGMSMLAYALAEAARRENCLELMKEEAGEAEIRLSRCYPARLMLKVLQAGAEMLAEQYPENVIFGYHHMSE